MLRERSAAPPPALLRELEDRGPLWSPSVSRALGAATAQAGTSRPGPVASHPKLACHRILQGTQTVGQTEREGKENRGPRHGRGNNSALQIETIMKHYLKLSEWPSAK